MKVSVGLPATNPGAKGDVIVEIATIITDGTLERLEPGPDLLIAAPSTALEQMDEVVRDMHTASGLLDELVQVERTVSQAEAETLAFIRAHVPEAGVAPLARNSVHTDRMFLRRYLPALEAHLHYRNVDVSTLKELARRWRPPLLDKAPDKAERHRALGDITESIDELRFYRDALFGGVSDAP